MTQITGPHGAVVEIDPNDAKTAISKLKEMGYEVFVSHKRWMAGVPELHPMFGSFTIIKKLGGKPSPKGGTTTVTLTDATGTLLASGSAFCSQLDNFDRKLGTRIALGRALKEMIT